MINVLVCIGLFALTMGMFFIGYAIGRLEETKNGCTSTNTTVPGDSDLLDALVEVDAQRNSLSRDSVVGGD